MDESDPPRLLTLEEQAILMEIAADVLTSRDTLATTLEALAMVTQRERSRTIRMKSLVVDIQRIGFELKDARAEIRRLRG